ncbi:MAG: hypothetical protein GY737_30490 [Desulfobacteraceae bacterium]|nr:hypothetical protein [Desulfobacteraceae bacterium]
MEQIGKEYRKNDNPAINMDTPRRTDRHFFRDGRLLTQEKLNIHDHDFSSLASDIAIPHGLYACWIKSWIYFYWLSSWYKRLHGIAFLNGGKMNRRFNYRDATSILTLCDCGGSKNARHYIFKEPIGKIKTDLKFFLPLL